MSKLWSSPILFWNLGRELLEYYYLSPTTCHFEQSEKSLFDALLENIIPKFNFSLSFSLKRFDLKGFLVITRNDRGELGMTEIKFLLSPIHHSSSSVSSHHSWSHIGGIYNFGCDKFSSSGFLSDNSYSVSDI